MIGSEGDRSALLVTASSIPRGWGAVFTHPSQPPTQKQESLRIELKRSVHVRADVHAIRTWRFSTCHVLQQNNVDVRPIWPKAHPRACGLFAVRGIFG